MQGIHEESGTGTEQEHMASPQATVRAESAPSSERVAPSSESVPPSSESVTSIGTEPLPGLTNRMRDPVVKALTLGWVPLTAALLSLILSVASIFVSTRQPEVLLILPDVVRLVQGRESGSAYVYLQTAYVSTGANDRVEVIRRQTLRVTTPSGEELEFPWDEQGRLVGDDATGQLDYEYLADPAPLLVSPRSAVSPVCLFDAPAGWFFQAGIYRFTVVGERVVAGDALRATFQVDLLPEDLATLDAPGPDRFLAFPIV